MPELQPEPQPPAKPKQLPLPGFENSGLTDLTDPPSKKRSIVECKRALAMTRGNILRASDLLGVTRQTLYNYLQEFPELRAYNDEVVAPAWGDFVEGRLEQACEAGKGWAIKFVCATKLKDRGYTTRTEHTGPNNGPMEHRVIADGVRSREELEAMSDDDRRALIRAGELAQARLAASGRGGQPGHS